MSKPNGFRALPWDHQLVGLPTRAPNMPASRKPSGRHVFSNSLPGGAIGIVGEIIGSDRGTCHICVGTGMSPPLNIVHTSRCEKHNRKDQSLDCVENKSARKRNLKIDNICFRVELAKNKISQIPFSFCFCISLSLSLSPPLSSLPSGADLELLEPVVINALHRKHILHYRKGRQRA